MTVLPSGWVEVTLGELAVNKDNLRVPVNAKERAGRAGPVPYYGAAGQVGWIDRPIFDEQLLLLGEDGVQFFDVEKSKAYMISGPSWVNNHAHVLAGTPGIQLDYLMHFLNQFDYHGYANGTTRLKLTRSAMDSIPVRVAPIAEQERIVAAIEEAFSKLDTGEAGLRTVRQLLKRMRDAVLAAAVTGRLVPQDPTDTPSTELLADLGVEPLVDSQLPPVPDGWAWATVGEIATVGTGTTPSRKNADYWSDGTVPWVTSALLNSPAVEAATEFVTHRAVEETSLRVWPRGTLLVAMYGEGRTRGRCAELSIDATCNQACAAIVLRNELSEMRTFLRLAFDASYVANRRLASGGVQPNLNLGLVRGIRVGVPPLPEQARIVEEAARQFSFIEACERAVDAGLARSAALRRSILKSAFEGKLVPQDPSDEPASVLLERIRAERAASEPKASARRRPGKVHP